MSSVTEPEYIDIGTRMAQELQDCIADAEKSGCKKPFPGMQQLIDEWETIYARSNDWQEAISENSTSISALDT